MKKVLGYVVSLLPLFGCMWIVLNYVFFIPEPVNPPNQTLRGTEVIIPIFFGVILAVIFLVLGFTKPKETRKIFFVWASIALSPLILILFFLWVIVPMNM